MSASRFDFNMLLHPGDEFISGYIRMYKCWEPLTTELLRELLVVHGRNLHNHVFLDIGANIGYFSLVVAAHNVMPVIAVEPVHENLQVFYASLQINQFAHPVVVLPCAVGDETKVITMNIDLLNLGCCSTRDNMIYNKQQFVQQRLLGDCLREVALNQRVANMPTRRYIVKMDVELQELAVLQSLPPQFLEQVDVLIVEISVDVMQTFSLLQPHFDKGMLLETSKTGVQYRSANFNLTNHMDNLVDIADLAKQVSDLAEHQVDLWLMKSSCLTSDKHVDVNALFDASATSAPDP